MSNTQINISVNRKHKDRLFTMFFGDESNKKNILSLYHALYDTSYTNEYELEITTIEDATYIKMTLRDAVERAINECIEENVLADFLRKHKGDVIGNCLKEYNEEAYRKGLLEDGRELRLEEL